jgi:hypothetical protein
MAAEVAWRKEVDAAAASSVFFRSGNIVFGEKKRQCHE